MQHPVLGAAESALATPLGWAGELSLLDLPRRAVLVSRTKRNPAPDTPWVVATRAAVKKISADGQVLVTGCERLPYDLALWTSRNEGGAAIIALSALPENQITGSAEFTPARHLLVWPQQPWKGKDALRRRDLLLAALAAGAYAVHVRANGNMAAVREQLLKRNCPVETLAFPTDLPPLPPLFKGGRKTAFPPSKMECKDGEEVLPPLKRGGRGGESLPSSWDYLTHFTREPQGAWPGETHAAYLQWLSSGTPFVPRDGFAALSRILREKRLRASGEMIPGAIPMVCFSAQPPPQAGALRRWRKGLARWSVSPYGLAIRKEALLKLGAQSVRYVSRQAMRNTPRAERFFLQLERSAALDWTTEAEWRVRGDIDLLRLPPGSLLAIVTTPEEAQLLEAEFGIKALAPAI